MLGWVPEHTCFLMWLARHILLKDLTLTNSCPHTAPASFLAITVLFVWVLSNYRICSLKFCRGSALWLAKVASRHKHGRARVCLPWVIWGLWRPSVWVTVPPPVPVFCRVISLILSSALPPRALFFPTPLSSLWWHSSQHAYSAKSELREPWMSLMEKNRKWALLPPCHPPTLHHLLWLFCLPCFDPVWLLKSSCFCLAFPRSLFWFWDVTFLAWFLQAWVFMYLWLGVLFSFFIEGTMPLCSYFLPASLRAPD